ncbi:protein phosphatase CheZ, partial [Escherichia coli]|uniref:protein phosphatase CheZ n=1 Tax=Escherichia coli TaxID=562 RepID=UPI0039E1A3FD
MRSWARSSKKWPQVAEVDNAAHPARTPSAEGAGVNDEVLVRIGHMTRNLHDSLRGLGFDRLLEKAASDMPDAR